MPTGRACLVSFTESHEIQVSKIEAWLQSGVKSPNEQAFEEAVEGITYGMMRDVSCYGWFAAS